MDRGRIKKKGEEFLPSREEKKIEDSVRPTSFKEFIGQNKEVSNLKVYIEAATRRGEPLDHILLVSPPGLGKTTLAFILARELGVDIKATSGPVLERPGDLAAILTNLGERDILFIDEIHRLSRTVEEVLYPALEDFKIDIITGQGAFARTIKLTLAPFTLVGATTRAGLLTSPLRDRFGIHLNLEYYTPEELKEIVLRCARILNVRIDSEGAFEIAKRSRGTPRIAIRLLRRIRDFAEVEEEGVITKEVAKRSLLRLEVDERGLNRMDRKILSTIIFKFNRGPVGLDSLATAVGEEPETLEDVYEPYLIREGLLQRTRNGRIATKLAELHIGSRKTVEQLKIDY